MISFAACARARTVCLVLVLTVVAGGQAAAQETRLRPVPQSSSDEDAKLATGSGLDSERDAQVYSLAVQLHAGAPFSLEESDILRRYVAGLVISELEADVLISRALYVRFVEHGELTVEQDKLLQEYEAATARRQQSILDRKMHLLAEREAAEKVASPRVPAAPPANDDCAGAEVIPGGGPFPILTAVTADITEATRNGEPPAPSCQTNISRTIWYTFAPATTAIYTISSCADAPTATTVDDTVMAVYTSTAGCAGPFTQIPTAGGSAGCDDDSCASEDNQAVVISELTAGTTYYVVVSLFGTAAPTAGNTAVQLRVSQAPLPTNETCASAAVLTLNRASIGTTQSAVNDYQLSGSACFTGLGQLATTAAGRDVVYTFSAPSAGNYSFKVTDVVAPANPVIYLASTCPAATPGTPVTVTSCLAAANRNTGSSEEVLCAALTGGQQVYLFVDETARTIGSGFTVLVTTCARESEPNNATAQANTVSCGIEGSVSPAGDADFFSLGSPAAGSRVFAIAEGVSASSTDFDLRVTSSTNTVEFDDADNDVGFGTLSPNIEGAQCPGGTAYLRVSQFNAGAQSEPYRLFSVVQPASTAAALEVEPNATIAQATGAVSNYFSGSLSGPEPSTDVDVYVTPATAGDVIVLGLDGDPTRNATPLNASLELLDSTGATLITSNDGNSVSNTSPGTGSLTALTPRSPGEALVYRVITTGTYYVRVMTGTTAIGTSSGDYLLSISKNCALGGGVATGGPAPGTDTIGLYVVNTNTFFLRNTNSNGPADLAFGFGSGAEPVPIRGDWDGNGTDTIGLYSSQTGTFFLRNSNAPGAADISFTFGAGGAGLRPVSGDWNNDGVDTIGLYNPATGVFFLRNSNSAGPADITFSFGAGGGGYTAIAGDWNGDGTDTIGLYLPSSGGFFLKNTNSSGTADLSFTFGSGGAGVVPLFGDWNGDGADSIGISVTATGVYFLKNSNSGGAADITVTFGGGGATAITGDWDGL